MWQTIRRPTVRERSKSYISTALYVAFFVLWIFGAFHFKFNDYNTVGFSVVRDRVIANYTKILFENQQNQQIGLPSRLMNPDDRQRTETYETQANLINNISVYDLLLSIDATMREQSKPVKISRFSTISTLGMMLGIKEDLAVETTLGVNAFFFAANIVVSFLAICMCYCLDGKINEQFDKEWTMSTCPPRDIVLEFKEKIAKQGVEETIRVCSLPNPPPNCPERTAFLTPVRYPRPGLLLLLIFTIFSTVLAMFLSLTKGTMFANEFFAILDYCSANAPFKFQGYIWEYPVWFLILCGLILYHYTVYGLTLILIEIVFTVLGVQERITPILVD